MGSPLRLLKKQRTEQAKEQHDGQQGDVAQCRQDFGDGGRHDVSPLSGRGQGMHRQPMLSDGVAAVFGLAGTEVRIHFDHTAPADFLAQFLDCGCKELVSILVCIEDFLSVHIVPLCSVLCVCLLRSFMI